MFFVLKVFLVEMVVIPSVSDNGGNKIFIPIPVPIYIPCPMAMYSFPFPVPVPFAVPVPVPIFLPTTRNSIKGIMEEIKVFLTNIVFNLVIKKIVLLINLTF